MSFTNPFANDPDFQYLAVDRKKLMEEQTQPFDAKTSCWIPDHKEGYLKATITATKGDEVTVLTEKNEVVHYDSTAKRKFREIEYNKIW